jgi:glycosyltransferase involved in cell wall biosynthesis
MAKKPLVVHYTIGFHWPLQGGVETAINDHIQVTANKYNHAILCKNGSGLQYPFASTYRSFRGGRNYCGTFKKDFSYLPASSSEFDESTIQTLKSLSPHALIIYGGDCKSMLLPFYILKDFIPIRILRIQTLFGVRCKGITEHANRLMAFKQEHADSFLDSGYNLKPFVLNKIYNEKLFNSKGRAPYQGKKLLYIGRICNIKRLRELVKFFQELSMADDGYTLTIVGGGTPPKDQAELQRVINADCKGIRTCGWVNHKQAAELYRSHDIVVVPSQYETFCSTALEGLACGCKLAINNRTMDWAKPYAINGCDYVEFDNDDIYQSPVKGIKEMLNRIKVTADDYEDYSQSISNEYSYKANVSRYLQVLDS